MIILFDDIWNEPNFRQNGWCHVYVVAYDKTIVFKLGCVCPAETIEFHVEKKKNVVNEATHSLLIAARARVFKLSIAHKPAESYTPSSWRHVL